MLRANASPPSATVPIEAPADKAGVAASVDKTPPAVSVACGGGDADAFEGSGVVAVSDDTGGGAAIAFDSCNISASANVMEDAIISSLNIIDGSMGLVASRMTLSLYTSFSLLSNAKRRVVAGEASATTDCIVFKMSLLFLSKLLCMEKLPFDAAVLPLGNVTTKASVDATANKAVRANG